MTAAWTTSSSNSFYAKGSPEGTATTRGRADSDEITLPKNLVVGVQQTMLDYLLRNISIEDVFVVDFLRPVRRPRGEGRRGSRLLHVVRARRLHSGKRSAARGGAELR